MPSYEEGIKIAKKFARELSKHFSIQKLIMFGSRAEGGFSEYSDFDLIIVSKDFEKIPHKRERFLEVSKLWKFDYPADFLCYTPEEFSRKKKEAGLVSHALRSGVAIV